MNRERWGQLVVLLREASGDVGAHDPISNAVFDAASRLASAYQESAPVGNRCHRPPSGWECTRPEGHTGACAAYEVRSC